MSQSNCCWAHVINNSWVGREGRCSECLENCVDEEQEEVKETKFDKKFFEKIDNLTDKLKSINENKLNKSIEVPVRKEPKKLTEEEVRINYWGHRQKPKNHPDNRRKIWE